LIATVRLPITWGNRPRSLRGASSRARRRAVWWPEIIADVGARAAAQLGIELDRVTMVDAHREQQPRRTGRPSGRVSVRVFYA
jgi:hypothetical protein